MKKIISKVITGLFIVLMMPAMANASDDSDSDSGHKYFKVTITNLTQDQKFTPIVVASSKKPIKLFKLGDPASTELTHIAEAGDLGPIEAMLAANVDGNVVGFANSGGLLQPGASVTVMVSAKGAKYISVASMLIPTNDAFFALNGVRVKGKKNVFFSPAYDSGTETNDENCLAIMPLSIPGPECGGMTMGGVSPGDPGEGYVFIHGGIHGVGDLDPATRTWHNPVAYVEVVRAK